MVRRVGLSAGLPPFLAAIVMSEVIFEKTFDLLASVIAFLCLIVDHFECPDILQ